MRTVRRALGHSARLMNWARGIRRLALIVRAMRTSKGGKVIVPAFLGGLGLHVVPRAARACDFDLRRTPIAQTGNRSSQP